MSKMRHPYPTCIASSIGKQLCLWEAALFLGSEETWLWIVVRHAPAQGQITIQNTRERTFYIHPPSLIVRVRPLFSLSRRPVPVPLEQSERARRRSVAASNSELLRQNSALTEAGSMKRGVKRQQQTHISRVSMDHESADASECLILLFYVVYSLPTTRGEECKISENRDEY